MLKQWRVKYEWVAVTVYANNEEEAIDYANYRMRNMHYKLESVTPMKRGSRNGH